MLSTLRDFSMRYPVRNFNALSGPIQTYIPALKMRARLIQNALHFSDSLTEITCLRR